MLDAMAHAYRPSVARRRASSSVEDKFYIAKEWPDKAGAILYWLQYGPPTNIHPDVRKAHEHIMTCIAAGNS